jgi:trk system potassium uptake protein TrkA
MDLVILGCGRVGARVANLADRRYRITVIDWNSRAFERLRPDFSGDTVLGNGIDVDVLRSAGAADARLFLALTDNDDSNLMAAQVARRLGARRVVARLYDQVRADVFEDMGVTTVSPTINGAKSIFNRIIAPEGA